MSTLVRGAAGSTELQLETDSSKIASLDYCFKSEKLPTLGKPRSYATIIVSKRLQKILHPGFAQFQVSEGSECDILMGCVGIVEGSDATTTKHVAEMITKYAKADTSWIPLKQPATHISYELVTKWIEILKNMYLNTALANVTKGSVEHYASIRDISLSFVWFQSEKNNRDAVELNTTQLGFGPLRELIMPESIEKDRTFLGEYHSNNSIEYLAECAKSAPVHHEATILRLMPEQLKAFIAQEFSGQKN
jgi:hypothetical protein